MMRRRVLLFVLATLLVLAWPPLVNLTTGAAPDLLARKTWSREVLYQFDFALSAANRLLWQVGISSDSRQVLVGRDGWLYLGDHHQRSVSAKREGVTEGVNQRAREISGAMAQWQRALARQGVRAVRVLMAPDKSTAVPEHLPRWASNAAASPADALMRAVPADLYVDLRPVLAASASAHNRPLFYRFDTHWTRRGAWLGYQALAGSMGLAVPDIKWLGPADVAFVEGPLRHDGDLARFLRLGRVLAEHDELVRQVIATPFSVDLIDYAQDRVLQSGGVPEVDAPDRLILARTRAALNPTRVLWLRDSFGTALSPFIAATFAEVLQVHPFLIEPASLAAAVRRFKPELVIVTVVERNALEPWFTRPFGVGESP